MEYISIKELADRLGVSKTAIRKRFSDEFRENYTKTTENGMILISESGCGIIAESLKTTTNQFVETAESDTENRKPAGNPEITRLLETTITSLQEQLSVKDIQLAEKDKQIAQLTQSLADVTAALTAAQALHAGSLKQLVSMDSSDSETDTEQSESSESKRGFFRFFKKNR